MSTDIEVLKVEPRDYLGIRDTFESSEISVKTPQLFQELLDYIFRNGITPTGPPFALYHNYTEERTDMECGIPVSPGTKGKGRVKEGLLPGTRVIRAIHIGPYDRLMETYNMIVSFAKEKDLKLEMKMWEYYLNDPNEEKDPSKWETEINWPIQ